MNFFGIIKFALNKFLTLIFLVRLKSITHAITFILKYHSVPAVADPGNSEGGGARNMKYNSPRSGVIFFMNIIKYYFQKKIICLS